MGTVKTCIRGVQVDLYTILLLSLRYAMCWPLHNIVMANIVWCVAYKRGVEEGSYIAQ